MVITSSSDDDGESPISNLKKQKLSTLLDLEAGVSGSESDDEQDEGEGEGSFLDPDHESVPASTQQVGSQQVLEESHQSDVGLGHDVDDFDFENELDEQNALLYAVEHGSPNPTQIAERMNKLKNLLASGSYMTINKPSMKKMFNIPNEDDEFTQKWKITTKNRKNRKSAGNRAISVLF